MGWKLLCNSTKPLKPDELWEPKRVYFLLPYSLFETNVSPLYFAPTARKLASVAQKGTSKSKSCNHKLPASVEAANRTKLVLRLIHRDSIFRPPYSEAKNDLRAPLVPYERGLLFLVNISIGEPPIPQLLAMDTGSSLTWLHPHLCTGCNPLANRAPLNDPKRSSTCTKLSCDFKYQCQEYFDNADCSQESYQCTYKIEYIDGSYARGIIVSEKFMFATSDDGTSAIPDLLFGCGLESRGNVLRLNGILGLSNLNGHSLVSRVGKKFSYCIGNISDPYYTYNQLVLGEGAVLEGESTRLGIRHGHYVVSIRGISVGETKLEFNEQEFYYNVVIDSGSTLTSLKRSAFEPLKEAVVNMLDGLIEPVIIKGFEERPCYRGDLVRDLKGFPTVTLHLDEETELSLDVEGMFQRIGSDLFCMAVVASTNGINIIGVLAQQYYNVGFDLNEMKVSFLKIECELLED
ncbi:hypothetical protein ABFS83_10G069500 [Erythranthe nasuta]